MPDAACLLLHRHTAAARAVNKLLQMAGGQCPPKGGAIDHHHHCHGGLVNQLTSELTN